MSQNFVMYKIVYDDLNISHSYVGHTTNFRKRRNYHKYNCNNENSKNYNLKIYQFIRCNGGWDNFNMIEIEKYTCNDSNASCKRERYWIETLKSTLNSNIPSRTTKEWNLDNKEYKKEYYQKIIILKKQKIKQLEIEKLELELEELELEFMSKL